MIYENNNMEAISGRPFAPGMTIRKGQYIDQGIVVDILNEVSYADNYGVGWIRRELSNGTTIVSLSPEGWERLERDFPYDNN